jgi:hypothetical protein
MPKGRMDKQHTNNSQNPDLFAENIGCVRYQVGGDDERWYISSDGTNSYVPSIYSGASKWNSSGVRNPSGRFNWRGCVSFVVPSNSSSYKSATSTKEVVIKIPTYPSEESPSYPYYSHAVLSKLPPNTGRSTSPTVSTNSILGKELCEQSDVTISGEKCSADYELSSKIKKKLICKGASPATIYSGGRYIRPTGALTESTNLYYTFNPTEKLEPGRRYYVYFIRQGDTGGGDTRYLSGHIHSRPSSGSSVTLYYEDTVSFSLKAKLDGGASVSDFSTYGSADFTLGGTQYTNKSSFSSNVLPGTNFKLNKVSSKAGYRCVNSTDEFKVTSNKEHILNFKTEYTLTFESEGKTSVTRTKLKGDAYSMPTYRSLFGDPPAGKSFSGWKNGNTLYREGSSESVDGLTSKTFRATFSNNSYSLRYMVDGVVVYTQSVTYGSNFTLATLTGDYMKSTERSLNRWKLDADTFTSGVWTYTRDITIAAEFVKRDYTFKFFHNGSELDRLHVVIGYGDSSVINELPRDLADVTTDFDSSYQKLDGWTLNDGSSDYSWGNLISNKNCTGGVISLHSNIGPRFKIVVYKDRGWKILTPIVSRETGWKVLYPRIDKQ